MPQFGRFCDKCFKPNPGPIIKSFFGAAIICKPCSDAEREMPNFEKARQLILKICGDTPSDQPTPEGTNDT